MWQIVIHQSEDIFNIFHIHFPFLKHFHIILKNENHFRPLKLYDFIGCDSNKFLIAGEGTNIIRLNLNENLEILHQAPTLFYHLTGFILNYDFLIIVLGVYFFLIESFYS